MIYTSDNGGDMIECAAKHSFRLWPKYYANLSARHPEKVEALSARLEQTLDQMTNN